MVCRRLALLLAAAAASTPYTVFGARPLGSSAAFTLGPNLTVSVASIYEADADGTAVPGHRLDALAAVKPALARGSSSVDGVDVTFATLHLPLASLAAQQQGFSFACPQGVAPSVARADFDAGYINATIFFGMSATVTFAYGFNNTVVAPANSSKLNIAAAGWPFCSAANSLVFELSLKTRAAKQAKPLVSDATPEADDDGLDAGGNSTLPATRRSASRRLLRAGGNSNGHADDRPETGAPFGGPSPFFAHGPQGQGGGSSGGAGAGNSSGHGPRPRDPRVHHLPRTKLTLLAGGVSAASLMFERYAYDSLNGTQQFNVTVTQVERGDSDHKLLRLGFPAFTTLVYDPTVSTVSADTAGYTRTDINAAAVAAAMPSAGTSARAGLATFAAGLAALTAVLLL